MKILFVYSEEISKDIPVSLRRMGYEVEEYTERSDSLALDDKVIDEYVDVITEHYITHAFSIHLIYNLAMAAYKTGIKYISYIWDAPYLRVYTPFGRLKNCYFSTFDKLDCERFKEGGVVNVQYSPLAVDAVNVRKWNKKAEKALQGGYMHDISFLGRLYDNNFYDMNIDKIPSEMQNYFESIFEEVAFRWDGVNRIYEQTGKEVLDYIRLKNPNFKMRNTYDVDDVRVFEMGLIWKIANIERIAVLNTLSESHSVWLYTTSEVDPSLLGNVNVGPPVLRGDAATLLFAGSKINLNISLKGIEGGTPLRVIEVLAAGGFMITSYCDETAEIFEEDKEIVMFRTPEELFDKVDYYLSHDKERKEIARKGQTKVLECYTLEKKLKKVLDWVGE